MYKDHLYFFIIVMNNSKIKLRKHFNLHIKKKYLGINLTREPQNFYTLWLSTTNFLKKKSVITHKKRVLKS